jgi:hypothetical protein
MDIRRITGSANRWHACLVKWFGTWPHGDRNVEALSVEPQATGRGRNAADKQHQNSYRNSCFCCSWHRVSMSPDTQHGSLLPDSPFAPPPTPYPTVLISSAWLGNRWSYQNGHTTWLHCPPIFNGLSYLSLTTWLHCPPIFSGVSYLSLLSD